MAQDTCSAEDCGKNVLARGMCVTHYHRWHRTVRPADGGSRPCKGCGEPISRTAEIGPIKHYHSPECRPRCSVDGCVQPIKGKGMCSEHVTRFDRTGDPLTPLKRQHNVGTCAVEGCDEPMRKTGWCASHYAQWQRSGEDPKPFGYKWGSDDVGYIGLHGRIRSQRGLASLLSCQHCGRRAAQWAYDHTCPDERASEDGPYSINIMRYIPLCVSCHKRFDLSR